MPVVGGQCDGAAAHREKLAEAVAAIVKPRSEGAKSQAERSALERDGLAIGLGEDTRPEVIWTADDRADQRCRHHLREHLIGCVPPCHCLGCSGGFGRLGRRFTQQKRRETRCLQDNQRRLARLHDR